MENYSDKKFNKDLRRKKIILIIIIIFASLLSISMLPDGEYFQATILATIAALGIYALKILYAQTCNLQDYIPKKGYKFYRKSAEKRILQYTIIQMIISIFLVYYLLNSQITYALRVLCPIVYIQLMMKRRIKLHVPVDDAMYFELEEMDIINSGNIVKSLYKDFETWENVKEGKKVLLVTQDSFICVNFKNRNEADKYVFPLRQIDKLGIIRTGTYMAGYLLTVGCNDKFMKIKLSGDSFQDSPEEFISFFIKELDRCKLGMENTEIRNGKSINSLKMQSEVVQNISIREIDFISDNNVFSTNSNDCCNKEIKSTSRTIDL